MNKILLILLAIAIVMNSHLCSKSSYFHSESFKKSPEEIKQYWIGWIRGKQGICYYIDKKETPHYIWWLNKKHATRIVNVTYNLCEKYEMPMGLILKQAWKETRLKWFAKNNTKAGLENNIHGIMQHSLKYWSHELYYVQDKRFAKRLLASTNVMQDYISLSKRIDVGMEMGIRIMKKKLKEHKKYDLALIAYWQGENTDVFRRSLWDHKYATELHYVKEIKE